MAHFLTAYRGMLMDNRSPDPLPLLAIGLTSMAVIMFMTYFYSQHEHRIIRAQ